jgi:hypothetical protein
MIVSPGMVPIKKTKINRTFARKSLEICYGLCQNIFWPGDVALICNQMSVSSMMKPTQEETNAEKVV